MKNIACISTLIFAATANFAVRADTFTWQGDHNNNFGNASNWSEAVGSGSIPAKGDKIILPHDAQRFGIDLGGNVREVNQVTFDSNGSTNSNGYNWELQNNTLRIFCDTNTPDVTWQRPNGDGTIQVKGAIALTADSSGIAYFVGGDGGAFTLEIVDPITVDSANVTKLRIDASDHGNDDTLRLDASCPDIYPDFEVFHGTLFLNNLNALPNSQVNLSAGGKLGFMDGAEVTLASTDYDINVPTGKTLNVHGSSATYGSISGDGTFRLISGNATLSGNSSLAGTLSIGSDTYLKGSFPDAMLNLEAGQTLTCQTNASFKGVVAGGTGALDVASYTVSIGSGGQVGSSFGGFFKGSGVINLNGPATVFSIQYDGTQQGAFTGTLNVTASEFEPGRTTFRNTTVNLLGTTTLYLPNSGTTNFGSLNTSLPLQLYSSLSVGGNNQDMTITSDMSGTGTFTKTGSGTLTYNGTYSSTGKFTLASGTLAGVGSYAGDFESHGVIVMNVSGNNAGAIQVEGELAVSGSKLSLNHSGSQTAGVIVLFTYGTCVGTFGTVLNMPSGYAINYAYDDGTGSNHIALVENVPPTLLSMTIIPGQTLPTFEIKFSESVVNFDAADIVAHTLGFSGTPQVAVTGSGDTYQVVVSGLSGSGEVSLSFSDSASFADGYGNAFTQQGTSTINIVNRISGSGLSTTIQKNITIGTADMLIVATGAYSSDGGFTGPATATFNGLPMQLAVYNDSPNRQTAVWYLLHPPGGSHDLITTFPNSTDNNSSGFAALAVKGVDVDDPVVQAASSATYGGGISLTKVLQGSLTVCPVTDAGTTFQVNGQSLYPGETQFYSYSIGAVNYIQQQVSEALQIDFTGHGSAVVFRPITITDYTNPPPSAALTYATGTASPTNATSIAFNVSFSEPVTGLSAGDFGVNFAGGTTGTPTLSGSGASYTLTVPNVAGDGTLNVSLPAGTVLDAQGTPNTSAAGPLPVIIDQTAPRMTSNVPRVTLTNADSVTFDVKFSESITGFGDASLIATGGVSHASITTGGSDDTYTVTVTGLAGDGSFSLDFTLGNMRDIAGNLVSAKITSGSVTLDNTPPVITLNGSPTVTLPLYSTYTEPGAQATDTVDGTITTTVGGDTVNGSVPGSYTVTYNATDTAGNTATQITRTVIVLNALQTWSGERGLTSGVNDGFLDDPNRDGRKNIEHFALDTNPLGHGSNEDKTVLAVLPDGGAEIYLTCTIPVRKGAVFSGMPLTSAAIDGIIYTLHGSSDLNGSDIAVVERTTATNTTGLPALGNYDATTGPDYEYRTFRLNTSASSLTRGFLWIEIGEAP